jgi:hypothetical protein
LNGNAAEWEKGTETSLFGHVSQGLPCGCVHACL